MVTIKKKTGEMMWEFQANDFKQACDISTLLGMEPTKCGKCGSEDIYRYHKSPKGNDYYGLACKGCGAEFNYHQKKEGGWYIKHDDHWTKFGEDDRGDSRPKPPQSDGPEDFQSDIPF